MSNAARILALADDERRIAAAYHAAGIREGRDAASLARTARAFAANVAQLVEDARDADGFDHGDLVSQAHDILFFVSQLDQQ